ncbi:DUF3829 domain-containing protein [Variovorax sp. 3319]|uniref:DUF3829 domain-containing protein n=1 Tax=Variovorax sp. 3319 TaxID=2817754 RepID=UPI00286C27D6|nr:DUF3829 domain-containing protein [Variovorax sp. 3319]
MNPRTISDARSSLRRIGGLLPLLCALLLAACRNDIPPPAAPVSTNAAPPVQQAPPAALDAQSTVKKMNAYTEGFNKLSDSFGLRDTMKRYFDVNVPARSAKDDIGVGAGWIAQAVPALKQGRAIKAADTEALDAQADTLIEAIDRLVSLMREIEPYFTSKAYKTDNLAKGMAQDILIRQAFKDSHDAYEAFEKGLEEVHRRSVDAEIAALNAQGNRKMYAARLGMQQAKDVIGSFNDGASLRNADSYAKADRLVSGLESTLTLQREVEKTLPENAIRINYRQLTDSLTTMVGEYRSLKESRDAARFNQMVRHFNVAVGAVNALNEGD